MEKLFHANGNPKKAEVAIFISDKIDWSASERCIYQMGPDDSPANLGAIKAAAATTATKSLQSCPTLCDPIDVLTPGSPVPEILQARTLEWVAISFSNAWKWKVKVKSLVRVRLLVTPWTAAYQAPQSMGFSRQEYWSGLPLPSLAPSIEAPQNIR